MGGHFENEARVVRVAMEHLDGLERELVEILAERVELRQQVVGQRDDVTADLVGLDDVEDLARRGPDQLRAWAPPSMTSSDFAMIGTGSMPASAMRPAKTET